ncbi:MAG: hypothetical protein R3F55_23075 [Alphaproteobacteria bacterium]
MASDLQPFETLTAIPKGIIVHTGRVPNVLEVHCHEAPDGRRSLVIRLALFRDAVTIRVERACAARLHVAARQAAAWIASRGRPAEPIPLPANDRLMTELSYQPGPLRRIRDLITFAPRIDRTLLVGRGLTLIFSRTLRGVPRVALIVIVDGKVMTDDLQKHDTAGLAAVLGEALDWLKQPATAAVA